jgi:hypothetical protein
MSTRGCCARCTVRADRVVGGVAYLVPEGVELCFKPHEGNNKLCRGCRDITDAEIAAAAAARPQTRAAVAPAGRRKQRTHADASLLQRAAAAAAAELAPQSHPGYHDAVLGGASGMQATASALLHLDPLPDVASPEPVPDIIMAEAEPSKHVRVRLMHGSCQARPWLMHGLYKAHARPLQGPCKAHVRAHARLM